jgi:hypothetical protein
VDILSELETQLIRASENLEAFIRQDESAEIIHAARQRYEVLVRRVDSQRDIEAEFEARYRALFGEEAHGESS